MAAILWAAYIFSMSTETFGGSRTRTWLAALLTAAHLHLTESALDLLNTMIRKLAHLSEYGVFSLLIYRSLSGALRFRWSPRVAGWAVLCAAAYSLSDELHQTVVPGRTPSLIDCGIDSAGALLAMLIVYCSSTLSARHYARN